MRLAVLASFLLVATACSGGADARQSSAADAADAAVAAPDSSDPRVLRADSARIMGDPAAKAWLVIASDFQCPWCKRWHDETGPDVRKEYVETGKIRVAYLQYPLGGHQHAMPAAEGSMCAGAQGKFWEFHDRVFATQDQWTPLPNASAFFEGIAGEIGLDMAAWQKCLSDDVMLPMIAADQRRAEAAGVSSTPTFFAGSQQIAGAEKIDVFRKALDAAVEAARGGK